MPKDKVKSGPRADKDKQLTLKLRRLGMRGHDLILFREMVSAPHGLILIAGPIGSGKNTALLAVLEEIIQKAEEPED